MKLNFKAILIGSLFIIAAILLLQLLYLFVSVGLNAASGYFNLPVLDASQLQLVNYVTWGAGYLLIMYFGGLITAEYADKHQCANSLFVGLLANVVVFYMTSQSIEYNLAGAFFFCLSVAVAGLGGLRSSRIELPGEQRQS